MTTNEPESTEESRVDAVRSFGRYLTLERELRGLSAAEVARCTRIAQAVIESIESGDPERMPPRGYVIGYLRSYAAAVGLDRDEIVLRYREAAGDDEPEPSAPGVPRAGVGFLVAGAMRRRFVIAIIITLIVAAAVAIGFRRGGSRSGEIRGRRSSERAPYRTPVAP